MERFEDFGSATEDEGEVCDPDGAGGGRDVIGEWGCSRDEDLGTIWKDFIPRRGVRCTSEG